MRSLDQPLSANTLATTGLITSNGCQWPNTMAVNTKGPQVLPKIWVMNSSCVAGVSPPL